MADKNLEFAMHIREAAQKHDRMVNEIKQQIKAELLGEGAPKDKEYHKLEKCWCCGGYQYSCACEQAFNQANAAWRRHIKKVLG